VSLILRSRALARRLEGSASWFETREDALLTMRDHTTGTLVFRSRSSNSGRGPESRLCM
jgi:hypothetical protein